MSEDLKAWPIALPALYGAAGWRRREEFRLSEAVFEAPGRDACVVVFHVGEIGVSKEVGHLAVFKDKRAPRKVWESRARFWWSGDSTVQWGADGALAFVYECGEKGGIFGPVTLEGRLRVLDLAQDRTALWDRPLDDLYRIRGLESGRLFVGPEPKAVELELGALDWRPF